MHYLNTDGGSRGNPGPAAIAFVLKNDDGKVVESRGEPIGTATNNWAEYKALILGLKAALEMGVTELTIFMDSELVVKQIKGEYRVKDPNIALLYAQVIPLIQKFSQVKIQHVLRAKNKEADTIVNEVLDSHII